MSVSRAKEILPQWIRHISAIFVHQGSQQEVSSVLNCWNRDEDNPGHQSGFARHMRSARLEISPLLQAKATLDSTFSPFLLRVAVKDCNKQDERLHSRSTLLLLFTHALEHSPCASICLE